MCPPRGPGSCGAMGCTSLPTSRPSPRAGRPWGNRQWSCPRGSPGRPYVPPVGRCIRNDAPPAANSWSVQASSHAAGLLPWGTLRSAPHERRPAGDRLSGIWCAQGPPYDRWWRSLETVWGSVGCGDTSGLSGVWAFWGATGALTWGRPRVNAIAGGGHGLSRPGQWAGRPTRS